MSTEPALAVFITVPRDDGTTEQVRVGHAIRSAGGFLLQLGQLSVAAPKQEPLHAAGFLSGPTTSLEELEAMAARARRTLADPRRARWHDDERALLTAIEAELERKRTEAA